MANIYTTIARKMNRDEFDFLPHCLDELHDEGFTLAEAVNVIRKSFNRFLYEDDESHIRFAFEGNANNGRMLRVIVFVQQGRVKIKTAYEIFE